LTLKLAEFNVAGSMDWSNVALTTAVLSTPVAALTGVVETTVGAGAEGVGVGGVPALPWPEPPQPVRLTPSAIDIATGSHFLCAYALIWFPSSLDVAHQGNTCRSAARPQFSLPVGIDPRLKIRST
jgi:hypothetical protein